MSLLGMKIAAPQPFVQSLYNFLLNRWHNMHVFRVGEQKHSRMFANKVEIPHQKKRTQHDILSLF